MMKKNLRTVKAQIPIPTNTSQRIPLENITHSVKNKSVSYGLDGIKSSAISVDKQRYGSLKRIGNGLIPVAERVKGIKGVKSKELIGDVQPQDQIWLSGAFSRIRNRKPLQSIEMCPKTKEASECLDLCRRLIISLGMEMVDLNSEKMHACSNVQKIIHHLQMEKEVYVQKLDSQIRAHQQRLNDLNKTFLDSYCKLENMKEQIMQMANDINDNLNQIAHQVDDVDFQTVMTTYWSKTKEIESKIAKLQNKFSLALNLSVKVKQPCSTAAELQESRASEPIYPQVAPFQTLETQQNAKPTLAGDKFTFQKAENLCRTVSSGAGSASSHDICSTVKQRYQFDLPSVDVSPF